MTQYLVLQTFSGSQTGNSEPVEFNKGDTVTLTKHLAEVALQYGYVEAINAEAPAKETKIAAPAETKPAKPAKRK